MMAGDNISTINTLRFFSFLFFFFQLDIDLYLKVHNYNNGSKGSDGSANPTPI